ncbi:hypothetical protein ACLOJK_023490 [Asimina triloba]
MFKALDIKGDVLKSIKQHQEEQVALEDNNGVIKEELDESTNAKGQQKLEDDYAEN